MTKITKLVMHGFKSFAKRTELPFSDQFNIVLGPNGSGKSNVIDGLCFVLGRLSSKDLRTEKLSHLIYNGGKVKQPASKGEVSVFFDNKERVFPLDENVIKITRVIKPTGQSVYKINDKPSTRQEILDTMGRAKINPNGYNIVLQGDIAHFIEMSGEELRQTIEHISGIGVYEEKKKKAVAELDRVEGRIREAEILLTERKAHLKELRQDRDQALKYKELAERIERDRATYVHLQIKDKSSRKSQMDKEMTTLKEEIEKQQKTIEELKAKAAEKKKEVDAITEEVEQKGEVRQVEMHRSIEQMRVDIATTNNRVHLITSELEKTASRKLQLQEDVQEIDEKVGSLTTKQSEIETSRASILEEKKRLEAEVKKIRGSDVSDVAKIEEQLQALDKDGEALQSEIQKLVEQKQGYLREKDKIEYQINQLDATLKKVAELEKTNKNELAALDQKRKEYKKAVLELNKLLSEDSSLASRTADVKKRLYTANEELTKLKMQSLAVRERQFGSNAVKAILEDSMKGVHGTVSQLGTVPKKYSVALETAAGSRINSIIVDTDAVAARCIKVLKSKKLGRATFLPLNKMREADGMKKPTGDGIIGRALDLVSFDSQYKNAFAHVFGNTLVVDDIEAARRIGIGTYRMVTLDGDLTDTSGAMHGGFRQKTQSSFKEVDVDKGLDSMERNVTELSDTLSGLERRKAENEEQITKLREFKATLEGEIIKAEKSLHLDQDDSAATEKSKEELDQQLKTVSTDLVVVEKQIMELSRKIADNKSSKLKLRDQVSSLGNPAVLAELTALDQKIAQLNEELLASERDLASNKAQSGDVLSQEKERIDEILKQIAKEEGRFEAEKKELTAKIAKDRKSLAVLEKEAEKFMAKNKSLFAKRTKLFEEIQSAEEKIIRKEEQINTIEVRINNITLKASEIAGELAGLNEEFSRFEGVKLHASASPEELKANISRFERSLNQMGNVNMKALEVYDDVQKQYEGLLEKKETLSKEKEDVLLMMNEIESNKKELFMNTYNSLNEHFQQIFTQLTTKGSQATLMIENPENPFEGGVRVRVRIAGEKFLDIRSLSGGEKTMTALSFIFAIQEHEPASFYIFDEVDAALDKRNSEKLAEYIKKYSEKAQYIVISHNDNVITSANTLYGVSMDEHGQSNVVSLKV